MKTKYLRQKAQHKLTPCSVFPPPLLFRRLSTVFFIDSETNETIPLHFWNVFHFFNEKKTLWEKLFSSNVCEEALSKLQGGEFWRETHKRLWLLNGRIIFLRCEKTSFAILIGRIIVFTCLNHSSLLWLARSHLRIKIYNTTFWWVSSQYVYNKCKYFFAPL